MVAATKIYTCIIVDDEFLARKLLNEYAKKISELVVLQSFDNAVDAKSFIHNNHIDILFLDINMPDLSGIELVKLLGTPQPEIVLTTANDAFAIEGYQLGITDYLMKPIPFERFFAAVQKAIKGINTQAALPAARFSNNGRNEKDYLFCKVNDKIVKIYFSDILFIESALEYVKIVTETDKFLTFIALHKMERVLEQKAFFRIHRSFIVNLKKIKWIKGNFVQLNQYEIPISKSHKQEFLKEINQENLF